MVAIKYAYKNVGLLAAQMFYKGPLMIDDLLRTSPKIGHINQKWSYNSSCFIYYALFDANMFKMPKNSFGPIKIMIT